MRRIVLAKNAAPTIETSSMSTNGHFDRRERNFKTTSRDKLDSSNLPLYRLKEIIYEHGKAITCNIPPNPTRGYIIKPGSLIESVRNARNFEIQAHDEYETNLRYG